MMEVVDLEGPLLSGYCESLNVPSVVSDPGVHGPCRKNPWSGWLLFLLHGPCMWLRPSIMPFLFSLDGWACSDWPFFVLWTCGRNAFTCSCMWLWLLGDPLAGCHCWLRFLTLAMLWTSVSFTWLSLSRLGVCYSIVAVVADSSLIGLQPALMITDLVVLQSSF